MFSPGYLSDTLHMAAQQVVVVAEFGEMLGKQKGGKAARRREIIVYFCYWNHFMKKITVLVTINSFNSNKIIVHSKRTTSYPNFKQNLDKNKMSIHAVNRVTFHLIISIIG